MPFQPKMLKHPQKFIKKLKQVSLSLRINYFANILLSDITIDFNDKHIQKKIIDMYCAIFADHPEFIPRSKSGKITLKGIQAFIKDKAEKLPVGSSFKTDTQQLLDMVIQGAFHLHTELEQAAQKKLTDDAESKGDDAEDGELASLIKDIYLQLYFVGSLRNRIFRDLWSYGITLDRHKTADGKYIIHYARQLGSSDKDYELRTGIFDAEEIYDTAALPQVIENANLSAINRIRLYRAITNWLYHAQRYNADHQPYQDCFITICKLLPALKNYTNITDYRTFLSAVETQTGEYYGEALSDDSDSDDDAAFNALPRAQRRAQRTFAQTMIDRAEHTKILKGGQFAKTPYTLKTKSDPRKSVGFTVAQRATIHYPPGTVSAADRAALKEINKQLAKGKTIHECDETDRFVVAQFRGIHYNPTKWSQRTRRYHRRRDERNQPQYAASVWQASGIGFTQSNTTPLTNRQKLNLERLARKLERKLLRMRQQTGIACNGYVAPNLAYAFQMFYTNDYDAFHKFIALEDTLITKYLLNSANPFVSTGDSAKHALDYASGGKYYKGHQDGRLRPRWRKNGKAERPHVGKVYASLHPLSDYDENGPYHHVTALWKGHMEVPNVISSERETTFYARMRKDRVKAQHHAKYPSFHKPYKNIYLIKYGLDKDTYKAFQKAILESKPHDTTRKATKVLLGMWLTAYNEVKLIEQLRVEAAKRNQLVVFRNNNGGFSFDIPALTSPYFLKKSDPKLTETKKINATRRSFSTEKKPYHDPGFFRRVPRSELEATRARKKLFTKEIEEQKEADQLTDQIKGLKL